MGMWTSKVIGVDNQILDIQVPARQMAEQIVRKAGDPPFLLGLQWSTTERMSAQQADILTSELDSGCILNGVIRRIAGIWLCPGASGRSRDHLGGNQPPGLGGSRPGPALMTPRRNLTGQAR